MPHAVISIHDVFVISFVISGDKMHEAKIENELLKSVRERI